MSNLSLLTDTHCVVCCELPFLPSLPYWVSVPCWFLFVSLKAGITAEQKWDLESENVNWSSAVNVLAVTFSQPPLLQSLYLFI